MRWLGGDKPYLRKSTDRKAQSLPQVRFIIPEPPHAQSPFLFPIVFGIKLIHFFVGEEQYRTGQDLIIRLGFRALVARLVPFERGGTKRAKKILAMESVNTLRISAPQW